jgi:ABC-2 type transport system ATP-binding protein
MIRVDGLTKEYGMRRAIDGLKFHAKKGEVVGFLGPNGAGKTTTMRILAGYMPPSSGSAKIAGFDVVDESMEVRRRVGYLPESVPLYTDMTVHEYLTYMAQLNRVEDVDKRVWELIETVKLTDRADSYIEKLSKGMRQRVGLAQALLHKPDVLILDEPTIGLDPAQIREVRDLIMEVGRKRTVLLSTHILSEAQQICDRVLIINKGKIVAEDTPENLEARLSGAQRVSIKVTGNAAGLAKKIAKLKGIVSTEVHGQDVVFNVEAGAEVRPEVAKLAVEFRAGLLEMRPAGMSLEEIFLQLTESEESAPAVEVADA